MEDYKISLSVEMAEPREIPPSVSYKIKVPNFFTMQEDDDNEVKISSPSFEFAESKWQFQFESESQLKKTGRWFKGFSVSLKKLNSTVEPHFITFIISLLDADNEKHGRQEGKCIFDDNFSVFDLWTFSNDNPFYDRRETLTLVIHLICDEIPFLYDEIEMPLPSKGMVETTDDCRVSLSELPSKTFSSVEYMMTLTNFFKLPHIDSIGTISSKPFEFCHATWQFFFIPGEKSDGSASLYLARLNSEIRKQSISSTISLCDEEDNNDIGILFYEENVNDVCARTFSKDVLDRNEGTLTLTVCLIGEESPEEHGVQEPLKQLQEDFEKLLLNGENRDLTLRVAEKEFRVHKDVLMARSPVFESMLSHDMTEKNKSFIDMPDCDPQVMESFLLYIYCGKVDPLNKADAIGLYYIADKYSMALLREHCSFFIKKSLSPETFCDVIQLSINHGDSDLQEYATEYFRNHSHDIFNTSQWMSFMTENTNAANELLVKASKKLKSILS